MVADYLPPNQCGILFPCNEDEGEPCAYNQDAVCKYREDGCCTSLVAQVNACHGMLNYILRGDDE